MASSALPEYSCFFVVVNEIDAETALRNKVAGWWQRVRRPELAVGLTAVVEPRPPAPILSRLLHPEACGEELVTARRASIPGNCVDFMLLCCTVRESQPLLLAWHSLAWLTDL